MFKELTLESIYQSQSRSRYNHIVEEFKNRYGVKPDFITRAPGRVNLIGQHIDYEGYGVLPFAIEKDCVIAVALAATDTVEIRHVNSKQYPDHIISADVREKPKYQNVFVRYFYAGYEAALRQTGNLKNIPEQTQQKLNSFQFQGFKVLIEGNVPTGSGLSSSSSFCVCSALATLRANNLHNLISKQQFITRVIKYERLVGTAIGGMDQSSSVLGEKDSALFIEFNPIRSTVVSLPKNYRFVIVNSLQESRKIETIGERYNKRVCECYMAVKLLALNLNIKGQIIQNINTFRDLQQHCRLPLQDMLLIVEQYLVPKEYSQKQLQNIFGPLAHLLKQILNYEAVLEIDQTYSLYNAAYHVYSEAYRVVQFTNICNSTLDDNSKGLILGKLMNESQASCKNTYKCSSKLIDVVTELARSSGAVGSRLTGAGWGGCTVSMVEQTKVKQFIDRIKQEYFGREQFKQKVGRQGIDNLVFQTISVPGACFVSLDQ